jgi:ABC-2 type transport system permease protein
MTTDTATRPSAGTAAGGAVRPLAGTRTLIRFILRRDRVRLSVWVLATVLGFLSSLPSLSETFTTPEDLSARAALMENPAMGVFAYGYQGVDYTYGVMVGNEFGPTAMIIFAFMGLFLVIRNTRAEEESGRAELVRAGVVGRHAHTAATLVVVGGAILLTGVLLALGMPSSLEDLSASSSWLFSISMVMVGWTFAAVALVAAQFTQYARGAVGISLAVFGAAFAVRSLGVMTGSDLIVWLSPLGWAQQTLPFLDDRWWPLLPMLVAIVALVWVAVVLSTRRDVGAGLRAAKLGAPSASGLLSSPLGLAWRLQRAALISWAIGMALFGVFFGAAIGSMEEFAQDVDYVQDMLAAAGAGSLTDQAMGGIAAATAVVLVGFAVQSALYPRREETALRAESVLATATGRLPWTASHLVVALAGSTGILLIAGLGYGTTAALVLSDGSRVLDGIAAMLAFAPAMWVFSGLAVALFGVAPRAVTVAWAFAALALIMSWMRALIDFPAWMLNLSPLEHVPSLPSQDFTIAPLVWLTLVAAGLIALGLAAFRRRDLKSA